MTGELEGALSFSPLLVLDEVRCMTEAEGSLGVALSEEQAEEHDDASEGVASFSLSTARRQDSEQTARVTFLAKLNIQGNFFLINSLFLLLEMTMRNTKKPWRELRMSVRALQQNQSMSDSLEVLKHEQWMTTFIHFFSKLN